MNNNCIMREFQLKNWVKCVVLKVGMFESEIVDEQNFDADDELGIMRFKKKYIYKDDYVIVNVEM